MSSRLFYHGTDTEVQVGDRVVIKRWFWRRQFGHVCYIPGISQRHSDLEYDDVKQWAIRTDHRIVYAMVYAPDHRLGQPSKRIEFLGRTDTPGITPDYPLE